MNLTRILKQKFGRLGAIALLGVGLALAPRLAKSAEVEYFDNGQTYLAKGFSDIDKKYILSGKTPELSERINVLLKELREQGYNVTLKDLLDGRNDNCEFLGIAVNEKDVFEPLTIVGYKDKNGEAQHVAYRKGERIFLADDIADMNVHIKYGLKAQENYQKLSTDEIKGKLIRTLDEQFGKVKDVIIRWTPRFEYQMGFGSEEEFRKVLEDSREIETIYDPHTTQSLGHGADFRVTYHLSNGEEVVRYVSDFPLSVLEGHETYKARRGKLFGEMNKVRKETFDRHTKSEFGGFRR